MRRKGQNWQAEFWKGCLDACKPEEAIWKNVIVALTFANQVDPTSPRADEAEHFTSVLDAKKRSMRESFKRAGLEEVFDQLSQSYIHPVGSA
ncbi:hypothetical protein GBAR_LOCUS15840, partial [Geodia barretti]